MLYSCFTDTHNGCNVRHGIGSVHKHIRHFALFGSQAGFINRIATHQALVFVAGIVSVEGAGSPKRTFGEFEMKLSGRVAVRYMVHISECAVHADDCQVGIIKVGYFTDMLVRFPELPLKDKIGRT